jgi:cellulose synthase/poly-beta-1,6-N-acetylglucosamine synthase-like glycosyltransferase
MEYVFFISAALIIYTYAGYPLLLTVWKKQEPNSLNASIFDIKQLPEITVVLTVFNGENKIMGRLDNILESNYPIEKLNIIVVSDGSTDNTVQCLEAFSFPRLTVLVQTTNQGKSSALNLALTEVQTPLVAFADLRQRYDVNALLEMVHHFTNSDIGAVTGNLMIEQNQDEGATKDPGLYWQYEKFIRKVEGDIFSVVGMTGAISMIRTELYRPMQPQTILDDLHTPMCIVKAGKRVVMASNALAFDYSSHSIAEEFNRKVRTLAGNYQIMSILPWLNNPFKNPIFWQWFSHKVCRLMVPFALIATFFSSIFLDGPFFIVCFILQLALFLCALLGYNKMRKGEKAGVFSFPTTFVILNVAAFLACFKYFYLTPEQLWIKR